MLGEMQDRRTKFWRIAAVFAATGALALSGCSSSSESTGGEDSPTAQAPAEKVDSIANTVPEAIKSSGKLVIGVNIPYAPNEFKDPDGKIVGFDVTPRRPSSSMSRPSSPAVISPRRMLSYQTLCPHCCSAINGFPSIRSSL